MRNGLVFFSDSASPAFRRRRILFLCVLATAAFALAVPIHASLPAGRALLFGLPVSMTWVIFWILVVFSAVLWLFCRDAQDDGA